MFKKYIDKIIVGIFIMGIIYFYSHLLIMQGFLKERSEKECVSAVAISNWEDTLNIAQAICVDAQDKHLSDIKEAYRLQITKLEAEAKHWKDSYFWLKKQDEIIDN